MVDYKRIIDAYIEPGSEASRIYWIHVTLVTQLALKIARKLDVSDKKQLFIEEASMLHDIGIIKTNTPDIGCFGEKPYIRHIIEGKKILEAEGLPKHALVANNHIGVGGLSKKEIIANKLDLPARDMVCTKVEEEIISYADLFYSKNPKKLWLKKTKQQIINKLENRPGHQERFKKWYKKFGD